MKHIFTLLLLAGALLPVSAQITLTGTVHEDGGIPVPNTKVTANGGSSTFTAQDGSFVLTLPETMYNWGGVAVLNVARLGWAVAEPLEGIYNLRTHKRFANLDTIRIVLNPHRLPENE